MTRIFISHSTKDLDFIRTRLKPLLDAQGIGAWCSAMDIGMGADWERQIRAALSGCDWFVVVLSPDAQCSDWVKAETHWALEHKAGRVIPVMARTCDPAEIHLRLATVQYIDFRNDPQDAGPRLMALIGGSPQDKTLLAPVPDPGATVSPTVILSEPQTAEALFFVEPASGAGYEQRLTIRRSATIGRADDADLRLPDPCISRRHARLSVGAAGADPTLTLSDLESANGTYVERERLLTARRLAVGDTIELGSFKLVLRALRRPA